MDLSLEMGMPFEALARGMTEREFVRWARYAERKLLPMQRIEIYLAQIARLIAVTMGGAEKESTVADFMIRPVEREPEPEEIDVEAVRSAFGYMPRKKRAAEGG